MFIIGRAIPCGNFHCLVMSPTARSLKYLREEGFTAQVVERFNPYAKVRVDLFGIFDIIAMGDETIVGIQVTSGSNHSAHRDKMNKSKELGEWIQCGGIAVIHSWSKKVKRNKDGSKSKVKAWTLREEYL